jgi:hypothetical protein
MLDWIRIAIGVLTAYPTQEGLGRRNAEITLGALYVGKAAGKMSARPCFEKKTYLFGCVAQGPHLASMKSVGLPPGLAIERADPGHAD